MKQFILFCICIFFIKNISCTAQVFPPKDFSRLNGYFNSYRAAFAAKDFLSAKNFLDSALFLVPDYSGARYAHMKMSLRLGLKEIALQDIDYLIRQKSVIVKRIQEDSLINAVLKDENVFAAYKKAIGYFDKPQNTSVAAFEMNDKFILPEGITNDPLTKTIYIGSTYERKVLSIDTNGVIKDFIQSRQDGIGGVLGLTVDAQRKIIYFCSNFLQGIDTTGVADKSTAVYAYSLTDAKLLHKYSYPGAGSFNDLEVAPNGDVYVTDSDSDKVYRINNSKNAMKIFIDHPYISGPNGIAFNDKGDLFVASYLQGILKCNLTTGRKIWLQKPGSISLSGNDGLEWYQNSLIINSPIEHKAVRRLYLNKSQTKIIKEEILAYDPAIIYECTTGTIMGNDFYFIGNSSLDALDGGSLDTGKIKNAVIRKCRLQ